MFELDNFLISEEIFEKNFVCNLSQCKGKCCIEGDSGAPITYEEIGFINNNIDIIKRYMTKNGIDAIKDSIYNIDKDGEYTTQLVDNKECAFVFWDNNNIAKCAIEKAYLNNETTFHKPLSCHLYPIRSYNTNFYKTIEYHKWEICDDACALGNELKIPVFIFLKEPIIRAFGVDFFEKLSIIYDSYIEDGDNK